MRRFRAVRVADLHVGELVKVVGTVRLGPAPLLSRATKTPCAYFRHVVLREHVDAIHDGWGSRRSRARPPPWVVADRQEAQDFTLEDDTGRVHIRMERYDVSIGTDAMSAAIESERLVTEGMTVAVLGEVGEHDAAGEEATYRTVGRAMCIGAPATFSMLVTDDSDVVGTL